MKPNCIYDPPNYSEYYPECCHRLYCSPRPTKVSTKSVPPSITSPIIPQFMITTEATPSTSTNARQTATTKITTSKPTKNSYHKSNSLETVFGKGSEKVAVKKNPFERHFKIAIKNGNKAKFAPYEIKVRLANSTNGTIKGESRLKLVMPQDPVGNTIKVSTNSTDKTGSKGSKEGELEGGYSFNKTEENDTTQDPVRYKRFIFSQDEPRDKSSDYSSCKKIIEMYSSVDYVNS